VEWYGDIGEYVPSKSNILEKEAHKIDSKLLEGKRKISADVGICSTCRNCSIYERELGTIIYKCTWNERIINTSKPKIVKCTDYLERNKMSLQDMINIAWEINISKKTIKGFGQ